MSSIPPAQHAPDDYSFTWPTARLERLGDDLWTACNTILTPLLDPQSFRAQVIECAAHEPTDVGLFRALNRRKKVHCHLLQKAIQEQATAITAFAAPMAGTQPRARPDLAKLARYGSLESMARFCGAEYSLHLPGSPPHVATTATAGAPPLATAPPAAWESYGLTPSPSTLSPASLNTFPSLAEPPQATTTTDAEPSTSHSNKRRRGSNDENGGAEASKEEIYGRTDNSRKRPRSSSQRPGESVLGMYGDPDIGDKSLVESTPREPKKIPGATEIILDSSSDDNTSLRHQASEHEIARHQEGRLHNPHVAPRETQPIPHDDFYWTTSSPQSNTCPTPQFATGSRSPRQFRGSPSPPNALRPELDKPPDLLELSDSSPEQSSTTTYDSSTQQDLPSTQARPCPSSSSASKEVALDAVFDSGNITSMHRTLLPQTHKPPPFPRSSSSST